jgi:hypothetical protein
MNESELIGNEIFSAPRRYTWKTFAADVAVALAIVAFVALLLWLASVTG